MVKQLIMGIAALGCVACSTPKSVNNYQNAWDILKCQTTTNVVYNMMAYTISHGEPDYDVTDVVDIYQLDSCTTIGGNTAIIYKGIIDTYDNHTYLQWKSIDGETSSWVEFTTNVDSPWFNYVRNIIENSIQDGEFLYFSQDDYQNDFVGAKLTITDKEVKLLMSIE